MRIRNKQTFDFWYPYAGQDNKGYRVKANKLSPRLPSDRFYDPALQRDWKKGRIDVLLDEADEAVLGKDVANCAVEEVVTVEDDKETGAQSVPQSSEISAETDEKSMQDTSQAPVARFEEDPAPQQVKAPVSSQEPSQPAMQKQSAELPPEIAPPPVTAPQPIDDEVHCTGCGRSGVKVSVKIEESTGTPLCKFCRAKITKSRNAPPVQAEPMPAAQPPVPAVQAPTPILDDADGEDAPMEPPHAPGIPYTPAATNAPSLADLQAANRRVQLGTPAVTRQPGVAIPTMQAGAPKAKIEGITAFMGDMAPRRG